MTFSTRHNLSSCWFSLCLDTFLSNMHFNLVVFNGISPFAIDLHKDLNIFVKETVSNVIRLSGSDFMRSSNFLLNLLCPDLVFSLTIDQDSKTELSILSHMFAIAVLLLESAKSLEYSLSPSSLLIVGVSVGLY